MSTLMITPQKDKQLPRTNKLSTFSSGKNQRTKSVYSKQLFEVQLHVSNHDPGL